MKISRPGINIFFIILILIFTSCSRTKPQLDRSYLPEFYHIEPIFGQQPGSGAIIKKINSGTRLNNTVISFWQYRDFKQLMKRFHPVLTVGQKDIINLQNHLNKLFDIFYIQWHRSSATNQQLRTVFTNKTRCEPMSNTELLFSMNPNITDSPSLKPLTILIISSHELLLQLGVQPGYAKIVSPYLRSKYELSGLKKPPDFNLFAQKKENVVYSNLFEGFAFCRKKTF
jgi:hypothetical protein